MKTLGLLFLGVATVALGGCYPEIDVNSDDRDRPETRTVARLTCPDRQGELRRLAMAADGRSCSYTAPHGGEVTLRLVAAGAPDPRAALAPIEAELRSVVPAPTARPIAAPMPGAGGENVAIDLPFFEVRAGDDAARVRMPGIEVDAAGEDAAVNIGGSGGETVRVNARDGASEVRVDAGRGETVQATYILARDEPTAAGWRTAGYQARGPRGGPLVVATARSRTESDQLFDELDDLIDRSFEVAEAR